ncbi:MAG: hypothetical protein H7343_09645 [Undibacterium sp.]|nr:hypothetical protein [Opitutaceae bacterium]
MDLATARIHIPAALERMRAVYGAIVFDEWALLSLAAKHGGVLAYGGPRAESFGLRLTADAGPLRNAATMEPVEVGDLIFALEAKDTRYDALLRVGEASYPVCNHTQKTMLEIRAETGWLKAQAGLF